MLVPAVLGVVALASHDVIAKAPPTIPFKDARIKFEVNATDSDGGIQIFVDADGWKALRIFDPKGKEIFETFTRGRIAKQGATELFLESAEPEFTELPLAELLAALSRKAATASGRGDLKASESKGSPP